MASIITDTKTKLVDETIVPVVTEMMRIFPDGLVITSGLYALFTLSFPFGVFFGSMVEATAIFHAIRYTAVMIPRLSHFSPTRKSCATT
jgi:hypothetical protein